MACLVQTVEGPTLPVEGEVDRLFDLRPLSSSLQAAAVAAALLTSPSSTLCTTREEREVVSQVQVPRDLQLEPTLVLELEELAASMGALRPENSFLVGSPPLEQMEIMRTERVAEAVTGAAEAGPRDTSTIGAIIMAAAVADLATAAAALQVLGRAQRAGLLLPTREIQHYPPAAALVAGERVATDAMASSHTPLLAAMASRCLFP